MARRLERRIFFRWTPAPDACRLVSVLAFCFLTLTSNVHAFVPPQSKAWPDPLVMQDGSVVHDRAEFEQKQRPEILHLFEENIYGKTPATTLPLRIVKTTLDPHALHGLAQRKQITLAVGPNGERTWHMLLYTPVRANGPVPVIVGLNFDGNQTIDADPGIDLNPVWEPDPALKNVPLAKELSCHLLKTAELNSRGSAAAQWQVEMILTRGYGIATIYAGDIEPDFDGGIGYGIRPLLFAHAQKLPKADDWGALGAWAWGMSRMLDILEKDPAVDSRAFIAFGFSRFGKAALWAAAQDHRFAMVISNESGQAGATLSHRERGESIDHLMLAFPYWFCANYQHYLGRVQALPVDGDLLLALITPRLLYIGSAIADPFSDPEGEFLSARAVSPVYALYGLTGITHTTMPEIEHSIGDGAVGFHVRLGGHDVTSYDWQQYLNFADRHFGPPAERTR